MGVYMQGLSIGIVGNLSWVSVPFRVVMNRDGFAVGVGGGSAAVRFFVLFCFNSEYLILCTQV